MKNLDFNSLNEAAKSESWCDSFAYWLLILIEPQSIYAQDAEEACAAMSFQHDVEDQAKDAEMLIGDSELVPAVFVPIAPVTLAYKWSPFPAATKALGKPLHLDSNEGKTLTVFTPITNPEFIGLSPDEQHFDFLLAHACKRAGKANALILLVGAPGWSYESEEWLADQPAIQSLMRNFGFVYTLRKPISA